MAERPSQREPERDGFTLVELLIAVTIVVALSAIALPRYVSYREQANIARAVHDLRVLDTHLQAFKANFNAYPASLDDVPQGDLSDLWGKPYQYLKIEGADAKSKAQMRKDKNLVPINSDYDLYSMGADGKPLLLSRQKTVMTMSFAPTTAVITAWPPTTNREPMHEV